MGKRAASGKKFVPTPPVLTPLCKEAGVRVKRDEWPALQCVINFLFFRHFVIQCISTSNFAPRQQVLTQLRIMLSLQTDYDALLIQGKKPGEPMSKRSFHH
jgi:hypothetical protein